MKSPLKLNKQAIYLPFIKGKYSTSPGLKPLHKGETPYDQRVFQLDENLYAFLENMQACRQENIFKYYHEHKLNPKLIQRVNQFIIQEICRDYPELFQLETLTDGFQIDCKASDETLNMDKNFILQDTSGYHSLFDALCCQIPEDIAIVQFENNQDFLAATHVCAPSHWAPGEKIGKNFDSLHEPVPGMEKLRKSYEIMLKSIVNRGAFTRFGWSVALDKRLNHHPVAKNSSGNRLENIIDVQNPELYVRVERQNLVGFPEYNAFIFTVRIYFYAINELHLEEKKALRLALQSMTSESTDYKGLTDKMDFLLDWLPA